MSLLKDQKTLLFYLSGMVSWFLTKSLFSSTPELSSNQSCLGEPCTALPRGLWAHICTCWGSWHTWYNYCRHLLESQQFHLFKVSWHQWRTVGSLVHGYSPPTSAILESHYDLADVVQQVAAIGQYLFSFSITFFWIMNCLTVMSQSRAAGKRMTWPRPPPAAVRPDMTDIRLGNSTKLVPTVGD